MAGPLADAAAMASAFVEYPCTRKVEIEALHLTGFPSNSIGQARLAIFKKVTGSMAPHYGYNEQTISCHVEVWCILGQQRTAANQCHHQA